MSASDENEELRETSQSLQRQVQRLQGFAQEHQRLITELSHARQEQMRCAEEADTAKQETVRLQLQRQTETNSMDERIDQIVLEKDQMRQELRVLTDMNLQKVEDIARLTVELKSYTSSESRLREVETMPPPPPLPEPLPRCTWRDAGTQVALRADSATADSQTDVKNLLDAVVQAYATQVDVGIQAEADTLQAADSCEGYFTSRTWEEYTVGFCPDLIPEPKTFVEKMFMDDGNEGLTGLMYCYYSAIKSMAVNGVITQEERDMIPATEKLNRLHLRIAASKMADLQRSGRIGKTAKFLWCIGFAVNTGKLMRNSCANLAFSSGRTLTDDQAFAVAALLNSSGYTVTS